MGFFFGEEREVWWARRRGRIRRGCGGEEERRPNVRVSFRSGLTHPDVGLSRKTT